MEFSIDKGVLKDALSHVIGIVPSKSTLNIVQGVLLVAEQGRLTIKATNLDAEATTSTAANVTTTGAIVVNASLFSDVAKKVADGDILFKLEGHIFKIKSGRFRLDMPTLSADAFPDLGRPRSPYQFQIDGKVLKCLLDKVRFIPLSDDDRPFTTCVYLHSTDTHLLAVATDGHRLGKAKVECVCPAGMPGVMIPQRVMGELCKLIDVSESVDVSVSDREIRLTAGETTLISKLNAGIYPDYEGLFNRHLPQAARTLLLDSTEMKRAVDRVAMVASQFRLEFNFSSDGLRIATVVKSSSDGSAEEDCACELTGEPFNIGLNYKYVLSILNEIDGEARFLFSAADRPAAIISSASDNSAIYLLMPLMS